MKKGCKGIRGIGLLVFFVLVSVGFAFANGDMTGDVSNTSFIYQLGDHNHASIQQQGWNNTANIAQGYGVHGWSSVESSYNVASIIQDGHRNWATIAQYGNHNEADITQIGNDNTETIVQHGEQNHVMTTRVSHGNSFTVNQLGDHNELFFLQFGEGGSFRITQNGGSSLRITQMD